MLSDQEKSWIEVAGHEVAGQVLCFSGFGGGGLGGPWGTGVAKGRRKARK